MIRQPRRVEAPFDFAYARKWSSRSIYLLAVCHFITDKNELKRAASARVRTVATRTAFRAHISFLALKN